MQHCINDHMDLKKRKIFLVLLGACGVILILLPNLLEFGSTHEIFVLAANFHNSSLSYLTSLNLNPSVLSKDNHGLQHAVTEDRFKESLNKLLRNPKLNVTNEILRYKNMHNKSNIHNDIPNALKDVVNNDLATEQPNSDERSSEKTKPFNPSKDFSSESDSYLETRRDSKVRIKIVSSDPFVRDRSRESRPVNSQSVLNYQHSKFSDTSETSKKAQNVVEDPQSDQDVPVYERQTTQTAKASDVIRSSNDISEEVHPVNTVSVQEEVNIQDNHGSYNENPIQNGNIPYQVNNENTEDTGLDKKSVNRPNDHAESDINNAIASQENTNPRELTGTMSDSRPFDQEKFNTIPSQIEQHSPGNNVYQQTEKISKPEPFERQADHVDTNYGKDLVREVGFTVDSSCIRRVTGVEDILCMNRPQFLPDFRNPCWYQRGSLRCLPYFHIIGVCKTGTTDLFERLSHHPQILKNNGILGKETWYWTWQRYGHSNFYKTITDRKTLDNFIDQFDADTIERYTKRMPNGSLYHPVVTGHGDPMDFWDQSSWKRIPQNDPTTDTPEVTTPSLIKHVNPSVKLILILRDPVERLFSNYLHGKFGTTAAEFHRDVLMSRSLLTSCTRNRSMKSCLYDENIIRSLRVPISGSFYSVHLQEWLKVFPRKQIFILKTEEFSQKIADTLLRIFRFLHLDPLPTRDLYRIANMPHFYNTKAKETSGEIQDETKTILRSLFEPYNNELAAILNDQKYNFNNI
ncbi:uncharacterized protein LOC123540782 isoform X2 [Mercenaria mercenaria]|uniref:uncharacterized protein LOC123540782 isoform X2 n=1 Tax=Mercenaria mercenaria TaxID=6596 RepID=UPI00234F48D7|nr:uncharacterized protein LOC123540782 isoform X2 [Mercenaria mercenaria]